MKNDTCPVCSHVLVIDDEELFLRSLTLTLKANGITNVKTCTSGQAARDLLSCNRFSIILLDINLPDFRGSDLLDIIGDTCPETPVVMVTAVNDAAVAVECMKKGALDYLVKPFDEHRLLSVIQNVLQQRELSLENENLKSYLLNDTLRHPEAFDCIVTGNPGMRALFRYVEAIAATPFPVLITGETGTGKELFAETVHRLSGRNGKLITVNVAGIDDNAFSDTLFGHVRGAFTGADRSRGGLIEQAAGGTLFLDEIGDLQLSSQTKLLRVIQNRDYLPLGSDVARLADIRLIVATNKNSETLQSSPEFRNDLYHRLKTHHIAIPPLRERMDDIPLLMDFFCGEVAAILNKAKPSISQELSILLGKYEFPGNVRELRSIIFEAVSIDTTGTLTSSMLGNLNISNNLPDQISAHPASGLNKIGFTSQLPTIRETITALIDEALLRAGNNQNAAARLLGISPQALSRRLKYSREKKAKA